MATPHKAATQAGVDAFRAGGNSVDAALAASAVLAVAYPHMCGIGGDLFAVVVDSGSRTVINGSGAAAAAVDAGKVRNEYGSMPTDGPLSVSVPGTVAAWDTLANRFGRLPLASAIAPAIEYAQRGLPTAGAVARAIVKHHDRLLSDPGLRGVLIPHGRPLLIGEQLAQPALAASLRMIAEDGSAAFYDGPVGARLVTGLRNLGSPLTDDDFKRHTSEVTSPLTQAYRGFEILVPPPNSQGFVLLEILACIERAGIQPDHLGTQVALIAQLFLAASQDRDRFLADPRRARVPIDDLLSASHGEELIKLATETAEAGIATHAESGDTVGIVAVEDDGPWVSVNHSLYNAFGSGILEPETGIICHNRGSHFSLDPAAPNFLVGTKRPAHTLMPVMVLQDGMPVVASATMGGSAHAQIHSQLLMSILDRNLDPHEAVERPRWLVGGIRRDGGSVVVAESRVDPQVIGRLQESGMVVETLGSWDEGVGQAQVITRSANGLLMAAADPRSDGAAEAG